MERSVVVFEPRVMMHLKRMHGLIELARLEIVDSFLAEVEPGRLFGVVVVEGENAVTRLMRVCGTEASSTKCTVDSIRYCFGREVKTQHEGDGHRWLNAVFYPGTSEEAEQLLAALLMRRQAPR